ncbi:TonB-dependent receptor [Flavobacterium sp. W21_SRS_FM6]|uniref:TonB-dependent receptor n=1 Tax=Flavobacterium sp. W21_SRS_FM6 TaxID=3240268 RepID=UPI003F90BC23
MSHSHLPRFKRTPIALIIGLSLAFSGTVANAQEQEQPTKPEKQGLETITVTAQKRAQNLQEVPVSVTAFTGDEMAESVIKDMYDLQTNVPGLGAFQSQSATNSSFSIRGVGTSSQNFGLESSVGLYVDGVYRARQNSLINNLVDVAAVEVLRGPQGTLFGKNTPSGAVLVTTALPSHSGGDAFLEATVGNYGLVNLSGATSISAIEDVLAFRVTAFGSQRDGTISDKEFGSDIVNDRDRWGARAQALYTPNEDVTLRVIADYAEINEICCGAPVQLSNLSAKEIDGKFGTDAALPTLGGTVFAGGDAFYDREIAVSFLPESSMKDRGLSAQLDWDLDENYTVVSISAIRKFESYDNLDTDFTDADLFGTLNDSQQSSFSQELRIDYKSDKLNYILGAYYFEQDLDLEYSLYTDNIFDGFALGVLGQNVDALTGSPGSFNALLGGIDNLAANGLIAPRAAGAPAGTGFNHVAKQKHKSYALFGQFDYKFTDELTLTAGLRFTSEDKDLSTVFTEVGPGINGLANNTPVNLVGALTTLGGIGAGLIDLTTAEGQASLANFSGFDQAGWAFLLLGDTTRPRADINETLSDDQVTGTIKLSYQPDSDTLWYASYGEGYKSGGTNTDRIATGFNPLFDAETSQAFEIGLKKDFPDQDLRINAATHYTTVNDFQANTFTGNGFNLQNAGDYEIKGLELEATWLPTDSLEVNLGYALVKAKYKTFLAGNCWTAYTWHTGIADPGRGTDADGNPNRFCDRSGDRPGGEPENYAVLSLKQDIEMSDSIYAYVQGEYTYTSEIILDGSNDPYAVQDGYSLVNARLFMNFLDYDMDVIVWARNLLDEEYINRTNFNTPLQEGKLNAYMAEPRTFGVTVKKRF